MSKPEFCSDCVDAACEVDRDCERPDAYESAVDEHPQSGDALNRRLRQESRDDAAIEMRDFLVDLANKDLSGDGTLHLETPWLRRLGDIVGTAPRPVKPGDPNSAFCGKCGLYKHHADDRCGGDL